jgi:PAS domain S-box-containing protein
MSTSWTVLVIANSVDSDNDYKKQLHQDESVTYRILSEQNNEPILTLAQSRQIDGILFELRFPHDDSIKLLGQLKEQMGDLCPPIVVIDGGDTKIAVQAFKNGAVDYLVKEQVTPDDLRLAMRSAIENAELRRQLQRSQEQFQISVENMLDCFGLFSAMRDETGRIVDFRIDYLNAAACENNQMPKSMQIGRGLCEMLPAHRESGLFDEYCRVVEHGEPLIKDSLVYNDIYGDRRLIRVFDIRATKLSDGFVASWRNVTERKRLELELRQTVTDLQQQQNRLQMLIDTAPIGIGIGTADGNVKVMNDTMLHMHGYTREEFEEQGMNWRDFIPPEFSEQTKQAMAQVEHQGFIPPAEKELLRRDGTRLPIWISGMQWIEGTDEHVAFAVDLTERKQAEEALRQSEDRLRMAIESAQLGTWDWNLITNELIWDVGCKAMFGLPPEAKSSIEVFFEGLHPDDRDRLEQVVQQSLHPANGGNYDVEYRTIGIHDKIERWIKAKGQTYFDAAGKPLRFIGTVLDITEQKQAEAAREQLFQQEQAAREAAERANSLKDEFLAVLSHELRSPLNPILGWTKLLQTRKLNDTQRDQALATIERNAKLQTQLIDDLLDVAKILRSKLSLNITSVNLSVAIEAAIETVRTAAVAKSISLHPVLPNIGTVSGDPARLQQIVWNLLSNAVKFTPNGGRVDIRLERVGDWAKITVRDTGKGINPNFLPHIFESFRQEDASITRQYGGLGLGLAIARQLVEAHGGAIAANSPGEGLGATFTIQLPLLNVAPQIEQTIHKLPQQELHLTGIRVLAVDDDPDARELLTVLLTEYGAEVLTVASASEVLVNLESFQPDVLICDIGMPEVDGYTLIQQVRALSSAKGDRIPALSEALPKAIALTAYATEGDRQRALSSGYQQHLTKPLEPERLVQAVLALARSELASEL